MHDILQKILAVKYSEVADMQRSLPLTTLRREAEAQPPPRNFIAALMQTIAQGKAAVIAEIKRASPSKGLLREDFRPADIAADYAEHGAACLSVLTDRQFFSGAPEFLRMARAACSLPVLRKDFIVDEYQIYEARAMGADAVLLIAAALDVSQMRDLEQTAVALGMAVLAEAHNTAEIDAVLQLATPLIGINNRDLQSFVVDLEVTLQAMPRIPPQRLVVAESGISTASDVARLRAHGVQAFLVGEAFMRAEHPGSALARLFA